MKEMKTWRFLVFFGLALGMFAACTEDDGPEMPAGLTDIRWKLVSFVVDGKATEPEVDSFNRYWLLFESDNTLEGGSSANLLDGRFEADARNASFSVTILGGTKINEPPDGRFFVESLMAVRSFALQGDELKLYYNETDYLLFSSYLREIESVLIGKGDLSGSEGSVKQFRVVTSAEEWDELKTAMRDRADALQETDVDFSAYQVIALFDELHRSGGWTIDIIDIIDYSGKIVVYVTNWKKGGLASVMTQPYHIVRMPISPKKVVFEEITYILGGTQIND
jgi:hypothetical protein